MLGFNRIVRFFMVIALTIVFGLPSAAQAYNLRIAEFLVVKNGSTLFDDSFTDRNPPPSAPNYATGASASYSVNAGATVGPESGGKLTLNSAKRCSEF